MGNKQTFPVKIFCFGNKSEIIEKIFPDKEENNSYKDNWEHRTFKRTIEFKENETGKNLEEKVEWNATIFPNLTDDNIDELFESLEQKLNIPDEYDENDETHDNIIDEDSRKRTRNIIIKFGKENSNYLINYLNSITKTHLPQILIVTNEQFDEEKEGLDDNRYLTIIKENEKTNEDLINDIKSYLWSKECYYNERGNISLYSLPSNNKINTNNYVNIMITGISRSGKSTLINVLSGKLLTLESPFLESVTNKIREYEIIASKNDIFQTGIRFFDTPGLTKIKKSNIDTIEMVEKLMKQKIKECNEAKENIHLIYFILKPDSNLENYIDFFKFIIELNEERIDNGQKKINIIFIINQGNGKTSEESLREFLLTNQLKELYDKISLEKNKVKSFKERFCKKVVEKETNKEMKSNIISVNILKGKNSNVFGIDLLLKLTLYYLKKDNPFNENNFIKLNNIKKELDEINSNGKDSMMRRKELKNEANNLFNIISKENTFLNGCTNIFSILEKAEYDSNLAFFYSMIIMYFFNFYPFHNFFFGSLNTYISIFKNIENCFKIFTDEISLLPIIEGKKCKGFKIIEHLDKKEANNILQKTKEESDNDFKSIEIEDFIIYHNETETDLSHEISKMNSFVKSLYSYMGDLKLKCFKEYLIKYFKTYIEKQCCIGYLIRQKTIYSNIFEQIDEMSKKTDWDKFHIQII